MPCLREEWTTEWGVEDEKGGVSSGNKMVAAINVVVAVQAPTEQHRNDQR
jgi:hypothetical protein